MGRLRVKSISAGPSCDADGGLTGIVWKLCIRWGLILHVLQHCPAFPLDDVLHCLDGVHPTESMILVALFCVMEVDPV